MEQEEKRDKEIQEIMLSSIENNTKSQWQEVAKVENIIIEFYLDEIRMDEMARETEAIVAKEEANRKEKERLIRIIKERKKEEQRQAEEAKRKLEAEMKARVMEELNKLKELQSLQSQKIKEEEGKKQLERELAKKKEEEALKAAQAQGKVFFSYNFLISISFYPFDCR